MDIEIMKTSFCLSTTYIEKSIVKCEEPNKGKPHDHGSGFRISKNELKKGFRILEL